MDKPEHASTMQEQIAQLMTDHCPENLQAYQIGNMNDLQALCCVVYHIHTHTAQPKHNDVNATDAARALAEEHGIDLADVEGTGAGGRIIVDDVQAAIEVQESA